MHVCVFIMYAIMLVLAGYCAINAPTALMRLLACVELIALAGLGSKLLVG
jgi:hypothetical protein